MALNIKLYVRTKSKALLTATKKMVTTFAKLKAETKWLVEHYWKKKETKKEKKKGKQALKYKGVKDSEIKKYTSCEDDGDKKVCTTKDGTKETVETYWNFTNKEK